MARCVYNRNAKEHNTNSIFMHSFDKLTKKRKREKKKTKMRRRLSEIQRERERRITS